MGKDGKDYFVISMSPSEYTALLDFTDNRETHPDVGSAHIYDPYMGIVYMVVS